MKNQLKTLITKFNESSTSSNLKTEHFINKSKAGKIKKGNETRQHLPN